MTSKGTLEVKNVTLEYLPGHKALEDVSLTVNPGEIVAILGPSGSGKSSLLRVVAGLESFQQGQICWNSNDLKSVAPHKRDFGFMFQDGQLFTNKSVAGNVEYGMKVRKVSKHSRKIKVAELLKRVDLEGFEDRPVTTLSGGQAQRVALARALAAAPKLIMLDEPLSSLDKELRVKLAFDLAKVLRDSETSAILVTHDEEEAKIIADRVLRMKDGKIVSV